MSRRRRRNIQPKPARAALQAIAVSLFEQQLRVMREGDGTPYMSMVLDNRDEDRRRVFQRWIDAVEAVSHKLTSVEYLELYNAALALPAQALRARGRG